jgi:hypothetical protein
MATSGPLDPTQQSPNATFAPTSSAYGGSQQQQPSPLNFSITLPAIQWEPGRGLSFLLSGGGPGMTVHLPLSPETIEVETPPRVTITQSLGGAWADHFGMGLKSITLRGHTGWHALNGQYDGFTMAGQLYSLYLEYAARAVAARSPDLVSLLLVNSIDRWSERVIPTDFKLTRDKQRPLLFLYEMPLTGIGVDPVHGGAFGGSTKTGVLATPAETTQMATRLANQGRILAPTTPYMYVIQANDQWNTDQGAMNVLATQLFPLQVSRMTQTQANAFLLGALRMIKGLNGLAFKTSNATALTVGHTLKIPRELGNMTSGMAPGLQASR